MIRFFDNNLPRCVNYIPGMGAFAGNSHSRYHGWEFPGGSAQVACTECREPFPGGVVAFVKARDYLVAERRLKHGVFGVALVDGGGI